MLFIKMLKPPQTVKVDAIIFIQKPTQTTQLIPRLQMLKIKTKCPLQTRPFHHISSHHCYQVFWDMPQSAAYIPQHTGLNPHQRIQLDITQTLIFHPPHPHHSSIPLQHTFPITMQCIHDHQHTQTPESLPFNKDSNRLHSTRWLPTTKEHIIYASILTEPPNSHNDFQEFFCLYLSFCLIK